jgi:hypothetical protein
VCLYVCDQETPKREAKGPSWTISACERMNIICVLFGSAYLSVIHGIVSMSVNYVFNPFIRCSVVVPVLSLVA